MVRKRCVLPQEARKQRLSSNNYSIRRESELMWESAEAIVGARQH